MSSLSHCIEIHGLHKIEGDKLKAAAAAYRDEGFAAKESNEGAVRDEIAALEAERTDIIGQIKKQLPEHFKAPKVGVIPKKEIKKPAEPKVVEEKIEVTPIPEGKEITVDLTKKEEEPLFIKHKFVPKKKPVFDLGDFKPPEKKYTYKDADDLGWMISGELYDQALTSWEEHGIYQFLSQLRSNPADIIKSLNIEKIIEQDALDRITKGVLVENFPERLLKAITKIGAQEKYVEEWIERYYPDVKELDDLEDMFFEAHMGARETDVFWEDFVKDPQKYFGMIGKKKPSKLKIVRPLRKLLFLKRKTATAIGMSKAPALQKQVDTVTSLWKNAPIVEVVQAQSELPDVILKASKGEIVDGVYYKGTVYIVADNMTSPEAAVKTLLHESFGHYGMRELLGRDFGNIMDKVYIAKRAEVIKIADEYGYDIKIVKDRALAADEWLAREAVSNPESSWVQKVIAAIRQFVRRIMPSLKLSNAEIQQLLENARTYVERGRPKTGVNQFAQDIKFSLKKAARAVTDNPNFVKWFGKSKVLNEKGEPLVVYHGTTSDVKAFDLSMLGKKSGHPGAFLGIYFVDSPKEAGVYTEESFSTRTQEGGNIMPVYLSIQNPLEISATEFQSMLFGEEKLLERLDELKETIEDDVGENLYSYDGVVMYQDPETGNDAYVDEEKLSPLGQKAFTEYTDLLNADPRDTAAGEYGLNEKEWKEFRRKAISDGYDGVVVEAEDYESGKYDIQQAVELLHDNYIAFEPTQIKSIYNTGAFGITEPDIMFQVRAFHGGPSMFERFRTARIGEGEGYQAIAWGMYFTDVKDIAKGYAERLALRGKTSKERYLYQVTLHKGKEPSEYDWLTWDKFITPETKDKVLKQLKKEFPEDAKLMVSWDMSYGEGKRGLTGQNLYRQLIEEIANTKNRKAGFEKFRPSDKEASLFLLRAGIDGVKYPAGTITGVKTEGFNYVVFDEEAVSIDERIVFAKRKPVPTKEEKMAEAFKALGIKPKLKPEEPLPKRARSVGLAYQDISEEAKRLEVEMGLEYPKVTRTHAELREQADRIMGDQEQLIKTMEKEKNFTEAEGLVVRRAAATGLESLMKVVATKDIKKANEMHKTFKEGIGNKLQDLHSEYGRNLESLKEVVSPESIAKAFTGLERDLNKDDMDKFNSAAEALGQGDAKPMINFQKYLKATKQDPKLMDYVYEYWYNSILSGVPTHVVNVASNTAWGAWQIGVHKPLLAAIDPLIAKFQKRPTEYYMSEIIPALAGIKRGFKPGIKGAKEMLLKGYTTNADLDKFAADMGKSVGAFSRSPNKYLKAIAPFLTMPTRALRGMDIWAKQMNYEAELGSIAKRMEKKGEGKYEELLKNPNANMMEEASQYADYTTFMGKLGKVGTMIEKLRTAVPGGRFIMPFVRTIANLVQRGVEMTPGVGAMKLLGGKVKGKEVTQVLVKQIEGAMIALVVASMFDDDEITGDVPANKAEREAFYRQGKKPWSIKVGDTWYQYRRIEPFNTPIAAVGILYDTWKRTGEEPSTEFVYRSAAGFVNNIIDSSYLSGLTQVLDSVRKADKWPQKLTNMFDRTIASFSPMSSFQRSFVRAIEAIDKEGAILRKPKGAIETLAAATPFISEMVPARKDVWGEEVVIEGSPLAQWLPWKAAKATRDVVEKEIERLHGLGLISYPGMPAKYMSVAGKRLDLDDEQYDKLITESGQASKKKLDSLVGTSYWEMLSDKEKASRVQRIIKSDRKKARNAIKRGLGVGAIPGMVPWKTTKKRKRPAWQEPVFGKKSGWQKSIGF